MQIYNMCTLGKKIKKGLQSIKKQSLCKDFSSFLLYNPQEEVQTSTHDLPLFLAKTKYKTFSTGKVDELI
jgi:hypothetical protein